MGNAYTVLPAFYDFLGRHPNYKRIAETVMKTYEEIGAKESGLILDLCCGTGKLTSALMALGADVIGVDGSPEMLNVARATCAKKKQNPLLLCQDMRELDLYGTVDVAVCATNSLNYLESAEDLQKVFALVHNFLTPGGLFFFDVDTLCKFETLYAHNNYVFEYKNCFCVWRNDYDKKAGECYFDVDLFIKDPDGRFTRRDEWQKQKYFSPELIEKALISAGFDLLRRGGDYEGRAPKKNDADVYYLARCVKGATL